MHALRPIAYLITWTTYGSWLHGDERSSVHKNQARPGDPFIEPSWLRVEGARRTLRHDPVTLDDAQRAAVAEAIREHASFASWRVLALNVRTNHVYLVIASDVVPPERVMNSMKSWATRRLRAETLISPDSRVWTRHGSTRWIHSDETLRRAIAYVTHEQ